jgi:UDP-N-acetylmuramyl pentapeptide phosphotransferase/UDP-N-acetylglucosamine-1-phosphate transferase
VINTVFSSITAFVIAFLAIPSIIKVSLLKNLYDEPNGRKAHTSKIPTLGGLAIFAGVVFSFTFWSAGLEYQPIQHIVAALLIMFFIGIKDDIIEMPAHKKLYGQILAAVIIAVFGNIRITTLCGLFGIYDIPDTASIVLSILTILVIINSVNLIDGIDGLAGGIAAIASFTFGLWFYQYDQIALCILSFSLFGALLAFLVYNFSPANIFMGDTGSLVVGLILSILAINFIQLSFISPPDAFPFRTGPAMAVAILIIPLTDLLRVFVLRLANGKSPIRADKNHIHHALLNLGLSHREVSLAMYLINIGFILSALGLRHFGNLTVLLILSLMALALLGLLSALKYYSRTRPYPGAFKVAK